MSEELKSVVVIMQHNIKGKSQLESELYWCVYRTTPAYIIVNSTLCMTVKRN